MTTLLIYRDGQYVQATDAEVQAALQALGAAPAAHSHTLLMTQAERDQLAGLPGVLDVKADLGTDGKLKASQLPASALVDIKATGMTLAAGVLTMTQDNGGPSAVVDLNSFATDAEVSAALQGKASAAQGQLAETAVQPGALGPVATMSLAQAQAAVSMDRKKTGIAAISKLDVRQNLIMCAYTDSTSNETGEWWYKFAQAMAANYPMYWVEHILWKDATQSYNTATVIQAGVASPQVAFEDLFNAPDGEVYGRTPDTGNVWSRDATNASGDWVVGSGKLTRTSDTTTGTVLYSGGITGDQKITISGLTFSTVGDGVGIQIFYAYFQYADPSNSLMAQIRVSSTGIVTFYIFERVATVNTAILTVVSPAAMPGSTASVSGDLVLTRSGSAVTASFGGVSIGAASISAGAIAAVAASSQAGFTGGSGNLIGMSMTALRMEVTPTAATTPTMRFYCAAMPGSTLDYQTQHIAAMTPAGLDVAIVSSSHNYSGMSGSAYSDVVSTFADLLITTAPASDIVLSSQNPQKNPRTLAMISAHADRCRALRVLADRRGFGYIPGYEYFVKTPGYLSLIANDGVHPLQNVTQWCDAALSYVDARVIVPRGTA